MTRPSWLNLLREAHLDALDRELEGVRRTDSLFPQRTYRVESHVEQLGTHGVAALQSAGISVDPILDGPFRAEKVAEAIVCYGKGAGVAAAIDYFGDELLEANAEEICSELRRLYERRSVSIDHESRG